MSLTIDAPQAEPLAEASIEVETLVSVTLPVSFRLVPRSDALISSIPLW